MSDDQLMPCPFCGGADLSSNEWWIEDDSEVQAVECNNCKAGSPRSVWNARACLDGYGD